MNSALPRFFHPATWQLLGYQSRAKLSRISSAFRSPRRKILSSVAVILGCVWVSQAVATVMYRQAADPQKLMFWLPLGLLSYSIWHLVKTVTRPPVEPFEWTPAELEMCCAAPISRTQLIGYRMTSILSSALVKSICFSVVMIPDLTIWAAGLLGIFLGLVFVDLIRIGFEQVFHGLSKFGQVVCRAMVLGCLISVAGWSMFKCLTGPGSSADVASPGALLFFQNFIGEMLTMMASPIGILLLSPFKPFSEVILADHFSTQTLGFFALSSGLVMAGVGLIYRLDTWMNSSVVSKEKAAYVRGMRRQGGESSCSITANSIVTVPWRLRGFGSLAWRQLLGACHYRMTLALSLGIPTLLCCIPLLADHEPLFMLLNIVGGVVFYSFLLLPSALMLDFRRDVNRMVVLKSLPIGPVALTLGQLAAPVLICSVFQWGVLLIAVCSGSVIPWQAMFAALLLLPINTLIFAIENFIFMLSPYRRNQEGLEVFLRTILTFTGKGLLFTFGLVAVISWAFAARFVSGYFGISSAGSALIFGIGAWSMTLAITVAFVSGIVQLYERFDPSQDAPSVS